MFCLGKGTVCRPEKKQALEDVLLGERHCMPTRMVRFLNMSVTHSTLIDMTRHCIAATLLPMPVHKLAIQVHTGFPGFMAYMISAQARINSC